MKKQFQNLTGSVFKMLLLFALILPGSIQAQNYCKTKGVNSATRKLWIESVNLGTISNVSGNNGGYANFTSQTATAAAGSTISYNIVTDRVLFKSIFYTRIFIDFNNDNDFDDAGETAVEDTSNVSIAGNISIPANASVGNVRVRIAVKRIGYAPNCGAYFLGETEDYTLNITPGTCTANAGTLTANNSSVCAKSGSATLTASQNGNAVVPAGYQAIFVLTKTSGLIIEQTNTTPTFVVTSGGFYTIHTLIYDPATLNLGIVVPGVTTGFDVNALLIQGGGTICASLDVAGASFNVNAPDAGTLTAVNSTICGSGGTLTATPNGNSNVPAGYNVLYVLTSGTGLVIEQVSATPSFTVTGSGLYTIHTLVYDSTLNLGIVVPGVTTGFDVNSLLVQGGGTICASLDVAGAQFNLNNPNAGTLNAVNPTICGAGGTLTATPNGNSNVPAGYNVLYVLTSGTGLVIEQVSATPSFTVTGSGLYTIHTLVYDSTLNLGIVVPGVTTGFDVNSLLVQGGGTICASLDVAGAQFNLNNPNAGTLNAVNPTICGAGGTLTATPNGNSNVPAGYNVLYVLTSGTGLVIEQVSATPSFTVTGSGLYTIHTLVYDSTLNLGIVVPGVTTGFDVNSLLVQGGGSVCASLDVAGAQFNLNNPDAGTLTAVNSTICGAGGTLSATPDGNSNVPTGYNVLYVLTSGTGLVIEQVSATPSFTVTGSGLYTIHTLVYDSTLNLGIVVPGVTTGFDVNSLLVQGGGSVCASLDVAGAQFNLNNPNAGTLNAVNPTICGAGGTLTATPNGNSNVPAGYNVLYVLTSGTGLVIEQVSATPSFTVTGSGLYTIHTLVYDSTLNLGIVVPGVTTGFDVNSLLVQGGGSVCASLDVAGAQFNVTNPDAGTLTAVNSTICGAGGTLTATPDGNSNVPAGYNVLYVLTSGTGLVIEQVSATPSFTVTGSGLYTIHTLVYDSTLNLGIVVPGVTTGFDVNSLLVQGGGTICASLDVAGAQFNLNNPDAGTLTAVNATICGAGGTLTATPDGNSNVPTGYNVLYVLTSGTGLVIEQVSATPSFTVTGSGLYTIHTLVYDSTLNLGIVVPGVTTGFDVNSLLVQGGGSVCASLDVAGAQFNVNNPNAGTLTAVNATICGAGGTLTATPDGNSNAPAGYNVIYVLTSGTGLVIEQVSATPSFTVTGSGLYTIHTLVYDSTLNLGIVVLGVTTGFDVNSLLVQGGGSVCASLDVAGAQFNVNNPNAGTLTAVNATICGAGGTLTATPDGNSNVPAGYNVLYVLTSGTGLVIEQVSATPSFTVTGSGLYTIHTLVYDSTLNLGIVVPGVTTGFDVNSLLVQGGGSVCASLDVAGAQFNVNNPNAGTLTAVNATICGAGGTLTATPDGNSNAPAGYNVLYVLTSGTGLVIEQVSATPSFTVTGSGLHTIHTLVYDSTLNLGIVVPGVTTGFDVNSLLVQGGGSVCASLDVAGAQFNVTNPDAGDINPDQFLNCLENGSAVLTGNPVGNSNVPAGYQVIYVLTRGQGLVIQQAGPNPQFTVTQTGLYRIHTLVYDPATLNLGIVVPGVTTGFNVNSLLVQGGGSICASLDVQGAPFLVFGTFICNLFGINNSIIDLPTSESQMTEESIRLAESSSDGGVLISNAYPNPAQYEVNIQYLTSESGISTISIQNIMGQTMMVERFEDMAGFSTRTINVSGLESGNYLLRLENNGKVQTTKVNVVR